MANQLKIELIVDDKGTATIKSFADDATGHLKKVEGAGQSMGSSFAETWQGMAVGLNQGIQLFQQLASWAEAPINAYMESEKALLKMGLAMKNQGDYSREALDDIEEYAAMLQKTTAYEDDAMLAIMGKMKSFGMSNDEMKKATQAAMDMSSFTGKSIEQTSDIMGKAYMGIATGLKKIGIQVDETAPKTELFNSVIKQVENRFGGAAQAELVTYAGQWKQLRNQWGDVQEFLGLVFLKTIEAIGFGISMVGAEFWKTAEMILSGWGKIVGAMADVSKFIGLEKVGTGLEAISTGLSSGAKNAQEASAAASKNADSNYKNMVSFDNVAKAIDKMGTSGQRTRMIDEEGAAAAKKAAQEREQAIKSITEAIRKANIEIEGMGKDQDSKDVARMESEAEKYRKLGVDKVLVAKYVATEIILAEKKQEVETTKMWLKASDDAMEAMKKETDAGVQLALETIKRRKEQGDAARDLYKDMRGYEQQYYDESLKLIEDQAQRYRDFGLDKSAIDKWVADEQEKAYIKMGQASEDWVMGVKAGLIDIGRAHTTWGATALEVTKAFARSAQDELSTNLFNVLKGNFTEVGFKWEKLFDSMLKTLSDQIAKMVIEAAAVPISLAFEGKWTEAGISVLGIIDKLLGFAGVTSTLGADAAVAAAGWQPTVPVISDAYGGLVPGSARYGGDNYGNDTVMARLSPGEYVMPRSAVNTDTKAILDYIRAVGQPPGYAMGGIVYAEAPDYNFNPNFRKYLDDQGRVFVVPNIDTISDSWTYRKQWMTGGGEGLPPMPDPYDYGYGELNGESALALTRAVAAYYASGGTTVYNNPKRGDPGGFLEQLGMGAARGVTNVGVDIARFLNEKIGPYLSMIPVAGGMAVFSAVSPALAAVVAAAMQGAKGQQQGKSFGESFPGMLIAAALTYVAAAYAQSGNSFDVGGLEGYGGANLSPETLATLQGMTFNAGGQAATYSLADLLGSTGMDVGKAVAKGVIGNMFGGGEGAKGNVSLSFKGGSAGDFGFLGEGLSNLIGPGNKNQFAFSARNGLDYVPRDNFLINAHRGERVQTADERATLASEISGLRDDIRSGNFALVAATKKILRLEENWDAIGLLTRTS